MTWKRLAACLLAAFAIGSVGYVVFKDSKTGEHKHQAAPKARQIVVYYFHGKVRCASCDRIEALGKEAVESGIESEIRSGLVEWRPVDTDRPGNEHFVYDYGLLTRSIVISDLRAGREKSHENLDRVWELLDNRKAFERYVQDEVAAYVGSQ